MASTETRMAGTEATAAAVGFADPAALGLAGFAATTLILSFINAGIITTHDAVSATIGLAFFYGGLCQLLAGMLEFRRGNTFGVTAFSTYGGFWLATGFYLTVLKGTTTGSGIGLFLITFGLITAYLTIGALRVNGAVLTVFVLLTLTFVVLGIGAFANSTAIAKIGGIIGIVTALAAFYTSAAVVVNATWKRVVLPVFPL
jgi:uncharacterized protein